MVMPQASYHCSNCLHPIACRNYPFHSFTCITHCIALIMLTVDLWQLQDFLNRRWFEITDKIAREKIGQSLRDAVNNEKQRNGLQQQLNARTACAGPTGSPPTAPKGTARHVQSLQTLLPQHTAVLPISGSLPNNAPAAFTVGAMPMYSAISHLATSQPASAPSHAGASPAVQPQINERALPIDRSYLIPAGSTESSHQSFAGRVNDSTVSQREPASLQSFRRGQAQRPARSADAFAAWTIKDFEPNPIHRQESILGSNIPSRRSNSSGNNSSKRKSEDDCSNKPHTKRTHR
uniref:Uncharacterized protein n=1 Tax=Craspedostauros australis TaxID=1486917 RepID=A0A7R9ZTA1_9STRA|mmetsp:Transcript_9773/g.26649  ORF Transcript_9773/g.26649 Transcript_9773/m.26649 type:complete len:292 (+) Transcript_9773:1130-2005(+)